MSLKREHEAAHHWDMLKITTGVSISVKLVFKMSYRLVFSKQIYSLTHIYIISLTAPEFVAFCSLSLLLLLFFLVFI